MSAPQNFTCDPSIRSAIRPYPSRCSSHIRKVTHSPSLLGKICADFLADESHGSITNMQV